MKKVILAIPSLYGGGAERVVTVWAGQLAEQGYDVSVLLHCRGEKEYPLDARVNVLALADDHTSYKKIGFADRIKTTRKLLKRIKPDVVISFLPHVQIWMLIATFGMKLRRIETIRNNPWEVPRAWKMSRSQIWLWHRCFARANTTIFQTAEQAEYFSKRVQKKGVVIPNPISKQYVEHPKESYADKVTHFVAAGRITEQKNYPVMIEAFSNALEKHPHLTLSVYGTGEAAYMAKLQGMIDEKGISASVKLMGRTMDMLSVLQNADAFLMTSDYEGMPNALAEAMATGLPSISTDCRTGPRDLIDDGENGFLVKTGAAESIAAAIIKLAEMSKEEAATVGIRARTKLLTLCSEENSLTKLIKAIEA